MYKILSLVVIVCQAACSSAIGEYPSVDCKSQPQASYPFCNPSLSAEERASDLVQRLSTEELIAQTSSIAPAIPRLGIKDYNWRSNCRHGWSASGGHWTSNLKWTVFPAPIGLGATFDPELVQKVGAITADEGRALHNEMLASFNGSSTEAAGLNCFSPIFNLIRDPRWGRISESFSEDPYLLSVIGAAHTIGIQGSTESKYLKIASSAPMYVVHSGPDNIRADFVAQTSIHDFYDSYVEAFKSQVYAGQVAQVMAAYSGLKCSKSPDGAPDAANSFLLQDVLRSEFEAPNISVISDNGGVSEVYATHHFVKTPEEAAAVCMNATTDLDLGHDEVYSNHLQGALDEKIVTNETIARAVWRSFYLRIRLGDFDPMDMVPYQKIDKSHLDTADNQNMNVMAAQKSIVLLKNLNSILPLSKDGIKKIAVLGPNGDAAKTQMSNYEGIPDKLVSILDGIKAEVGDGVEVAYESGCKDTSCTDDSEFIKALDAVKDSSVVVMVMGLDGHLEGEGHDRVSHKCKEEDIDVLALPGCQGKLVSAVANVSKNVVIVLMNGGPISLGTEVYGNDNIGGVLEVFYPGALGGTAVANVMFGHYNPAGRMPYTVYRYFSSKDIPDPTDYNMNTAPGRTYRYYTDLPEVYFGDGLSYTTFTYSDISISSNSIKQCDSVKVWSTVTNTGKMDGEEVVQVYISQFLDKNKPLIELVGFTRQNIIAGKNSTFSFTINPYLLSFVAEDGERYIFPGTGDKAYGISIDSSSWVSASSSGGGQVFFTIEGSEPVKLSDCVGAPKCMAC